MEFKKLDPKKVEIRLDKLINKLQISNKISVQWIKDFIYNFDLPTNQISEKYFGRLTDLLPRDIKDKDFEEALQIFNEAWNCFPQKITGGKSPQDKFFEESKNNKEENRNISKTLTPQEKMIQNHFDYATEHLDEYMDWAFKEVLPKYDSYLKNNKIDRRKERVGVADVFLETCGRLGFFEISNLPPKFLTDFPDMFFEVVKGPKISKKNIALYLNDFLSFVSIYYPKI